MANGTNEAIICRYIEAFLNKHWPDVHFKADVMYSPMDLCLHVRVLCPTPSGKMVYVVQRNDEEEIQSFRDFKLRDETIAQIMLLMG